MTFRSDLQGGITNIKIIASYFNKIVRNSKWPNSKTEKMIF